MQHKFVVYLQPHDVLVNDKVVTEYFAEKFLEFRISYFIYYLDAGVDIEQVPKQQI